MHEAIAKMVAKYQCRGLNDYINALREILQEIAMLGLWRSKFFEKAACYGGTALRILYGLDRFSEDIDFSLLEPFVLLYCRTSLQARCTPFSVEIGKAALKGETGMTSYGMPQTILNCTWCTLKRACARQVTGRAMIL